MLKTFATERADFHMSIEQAQAYDQRPFRSMLIQEWIAFTPGKGFHITKKGREAWYEFGNTDIGRRDHTRPLTAYFDATLYGLKTPKKRKGPAKKQALHLTVREMKAAAGVH